jgi:hypothetical protein
VNETDKWGKDPSVQRMRRVFRAMEEAQFTFLEHLNLSPLDARLRRWRERGRIAFEAAYARAAREGANPEEEWAGNLYVRCLGRILAAEGVEVPEKILPRTEHLEKMLGEVSF